MSCIEYDNFNVTFTEFSACYCSPMRALSFAPDWPAKEGGDKPSLSVPPTTPSAFVARFLFIFTATPFNLSTFKCGHYANYTLCLRPWFWVQYLLYSYCHLAAEFITMSFISYVLVPVANILNRLEKKKEEEYSGLWWKLFFFF